MVVSGKKKSVVPVKKAVGKTATKDTNQIRTRIKATVLA
jgi:hypothetical protein